MGDTLPPWLRFSGETEICIAIQHSLFRKEESKEKRKVGKWEGKSPRGTETEKERGGWCRLQWAVGIRLLHWQHVICGFPLGGLGWVKGTSSEGAPGKHTEAKRSPDFMGHLLPPLKALLNHNQITVNCRFLLDRKALEPHSSQHDSLGTAVPQGGASDSTLVLGSEGTNLGALNQYLTENLSVPNIPSH